MQLKNLYFENRPIFWKPLTWIESYLKLNICKIASYDGKKAI